MSEGSNVPSDTIVLRSPVTGACFAEVVESGPEGVAASVEKARRAAVQMRDLSVWERADLLLATADALNARRQAAIEDLLLEHGKIRSDAEKEFDRAVAGLRSTAESARRLDGRITATARASTKVLTQRQPLGVVGAITPWNLPFMIPLEYAAPALAMGNALVWKPAESVPLSSQHLQVAFEEAGWPEGAVEVVTGGPATGSALAHHRGLDALGFTGSSDVGLEISEIGGMRKLILELGGNGPTVVFADADIGKAADRIATGAYFLSGQSCAATERVLVEASAHHDLVEALVERTRCERLGDPRDPSSTLGPVHLVGTSTTIQRHIADARSRGATVLVGGCHLADMPTDQYWEPTVLCDVTPAMAVFNEETFGPVIPVTPFSDEQEARALARCGQYGLAAAVFTRDLTRAFRVADWLPASHVVVNNTSNYWEWQLPWGGGPDTRSGIGRLGGDYILTELSTTKSIAIDLA